MRALKLITLDVTNTILRVKNGVPGAYKEVGKSFGILNKTAVETIDICFKQSFKEMWELSPNFGYGKISVS